MSQDKRINKDERKLLEEIESICGVSFRRVNMKSYSTPENLFNFNEEGFINMLGFDFTSIEIDEKKLKLLGETLRKLRHIDRFLLKQPKGSLVPEWMEYLDSISDLVFVESALTSIPEFLKEFQNLKILILSGNRIENLPEWLLNLPNLKEFTLNNRIQTLNLTASNMNILRELDVKGVKIADPTFTLHLKLKVPLDEIAVIKKITWYEDGLNRVVFERINSINQPWRSLGGYGVKIRVFGGKIVHLGIEDTKLGEIPEDIRVLKDLRILSLINNKIFTLPESIGQLHNLKEINLSKNQLSELPESFSNLVSVEKLDLSYNKFNEIPTQLWALKELTHLDLSINPLSGEEKTIIQKVPDLIRDYLRKKATIQVFISHAVADFEGYHIGDLVEFLEKQKEISEVYFCEENLAGNIDEWMLDTVQKCQLLLFIATKKSVFNSVDCANELHLADKFSIPIIPIKGYDVNWTDLAEKNLSRELGLEFNGDNFNIFCQDLYKYIENFKREINLMEREERTNGIMDIYERFRLILEDTIRDLNRGISNLTKKIDELSERLTNLEKKL